jgi:hypothetical protein
MVRIIVGRTGLRGGAGARGKTGSSGRAGLRGSMMSQGGMIREVLNRASGLTEALVRVVSIGSYLQMLSLILSGDLYSEIGRPAIDAAIINSLVE